MDKDTGAMLKKVILYDLIILILTLAAAALFFRDLTVAVIIGILIAFVNFLLNAIVTNYSMRLSGSTLFIILGSILRIVIAGSFAIILYQGNIYNIIAYLIGYSLHYFAIILYGVTRSGQRK